MRGFHGQALGRGITRSFESDNEARREFQRILSAVGLNWLSDRIILRASADTSNAAAYLSPSGERFIFYNAVFMQRVKQRTADHWSLISILAHEVGHHLAYHTEARGRWHEYELEVDYFSGFVLRRLGASLAEAQAAMRLIGQPKATKTHPALAERLQKITLGWTDGGGDEAPRGVKGVGRDTDGTLRRAPRGQADGGAARVGQTGDGGGRAGSMNACIEIGRRLPRVIELRVDMTFCDAERAHYARVLRIANRRVTFDDNGTKQLTCRQGILCAFDWPVKPLFKISARADAALGIAPSARMLPRR